MDREESEIPMPVGELAVRTLAMPGDTNAQGDIFGGWVMSQMDIAGSIICKRRAKGRVVTASVDKMSFHLPVMVGDVLCCFVSDLVVGRTSLRVKVEAWVERELEDYHFKVTEGLFTFVAVDNTRRPRPVGRG